MSVNSVHVDWLVSNADWLLALGGSSNLENGNNVRDGFVSNSAELVERIKARKKKAGSERPSQMPM